MSRLCRLKTASHGDDGQWAYDEIVSLRKQRDNLLAELERLSFAALCRDSTIGDQCRLIEVRAELAAANKQAMEAIARVKGEQ